MFECMKSRYLSPYIKDSFPPLLILAYSLPGLHYVPGLHLSVSPPLISINIRQDVLNLWGLRSRTTFLQHQSLQQTWRICLHILSFLPQSQHTSLGPWWFIHYRVECVLPCSPTGSSGEFR